jgi:hypothetical protein
LKVKGDITGGNKFVYSIETAEKAVQDTSCRGSGGAPPDMKVPQDWGIRGLIETIPTFYQFFTEPGGM